MHQCLIVYLDQDANGDDLLGRDGKPITPGFYRFDWPLDGSEPDGPFETELDAGDGIAL